MTYTLDAFVKDAQSALGADNSPAGREKVRVLLEKLLTNRQFVDEAVGPAAPMGTRKLYEDKDLGFVVLAHVNAKGHKSPPHDHGSLLGGLRPGGQVHRHERVQAARRRPRRGRRQAREGEESYRLEPGHAGVYDVATCTRSTIPTAAASCASPAATSITSSGSSTTPPPARRSRSKAPRRASSSLIRACECA